MKLQTEKLQCKFIYVFEYDAFAFTLYVSLKERSLFSRHEKLMIDADELLLVFYFIFLSERSARLR